MRSNRHRPLQCNGTGPLPLPEAEVGEGAEALPTDFLNDLQCLCNAEDLAC